MYSPEYFSLIHAFISKEIYMYSKKNGTIFLHASTEREN